MSIDDVLHKHLDTLMAVPGVTGVGIGASRGRPAIVVMVEELTTDVKARLPSSLDGIAVVVERSGEIQAF